MDILLFTWELTLFQQDLLIERGLEVVGELNEPDNVNILTFDEADRAEQQQQSPVSTLPVTWRPGNISLIDS